MSRFKWPLLLFALLLSPLLGWEAHAQTINAASCSQADVQTALNAVNGSTATVNIPAGTCTWTNNINFTVPARTTNFTLIGAGNSSTGGGDQTVILDHYPHNGQGSILNFYIAATNGSFRFSGITIKQDSGSTGTNNCDVGFGGSTPNFRVDHSHFWARGQSGSTCMAIVYNNVYGVFDHNLFDMTPGGVDNGVRVNNSTGFGDSSGNGNLSWSNPTSFGSANFLYFENNTYNYSISNDCNAGGRQVFRYNSFNDSSIQTHEMEGDARGCRATEVYKNTFQGVVGDSVNSYTTVGFRMGTGLVWGNTSTNMANLITMDSDRTNGHPFLTGSNGFGYCGSLGVIAGPSAWDGNQIDGYPCLDQAGRGQSDVLTGNFPTKCDQTTGCTTYNGTWPHNKLEPIYEWLNQYAIGGQQQKIFGIGSTSLFAANRDYYPYTLAWNGGSFTGTAFNGTVGTGSGPLSARPSTCSAGPGGNTNGVAYWATDTNTLYVCNPTNTWTTYYTPYTYPHPLTLGAGTSSSSAPAPPSNVTATVQ